MEKKIICPKCKSDDTKIYQSGISSKLGMNSSFNFESKPVLFFCYGCGSSFSDKN